MTLSLFPDPEQTARAALLYEAWVAARARSVARARPLRPLSPESAAIYRVMWGRFVDWCAHHRVCLETIAEGEVGRFLESLGDQDAVSARYGRRMLRLIDRVDAFHAASRPRNPAIARCLAQPRWRARDDDEDALPDTLSARQARRIVEHVTLRTGAPAAVTWQDLRNRTAVALQLGAGLTPGEVRTLALHHIEFDEAGQRRRPRVLALPANGNFPARRTPLARWAARQLGHWLAIRAENAIAGPWVLPSTRSGTAWGKTSCTLACRSVLERAGLPDASGGSFRLRHTYALRQLNRHASADVASWLGIQDLAGMDRYHQLHARLADAL